MEDLTFRFDVADGKVSSIAFALTKKAENDILSAEKSWSQISRFTILNFMEDYQTAYALKRLDFLQSIFSDDAIIITGAFVKTLPTTDLEGTQPRLKPETTVRYTRLNKDEFIRRLAQQFKARDYIHLTYEDNQTRLVNTNGLLPDGAAFAIQIRQMYSSSHYSDQGYLTLMLNMQGEYPSIVVRLWQPEAKDVDSLTSFVSRFNF
jgi:hypothetical protein